MQDLIKGKAYVIGDNIDTDQIIPAKHLVYSLSDPEERKLYGKYAFSGVPDAAAGLPQGNVKFVPENDYRSPYRIVIGGKNFGCSASAACSRNLTRGSSTGTSWTAPSVCRSNPPNASSPRSRPAMSWRSTSRRAR